MRWNSVWRKSFFARRKASKKNSSPRPLTSASMVAPLAAEISPLFSMVASMHRARPLAICSKVMEAILG